MVLKEDRVEVVVDSLRATGATGEWRSQSATVVLSCEKAAAATPAIVGLRPVHAAIRGRIIGTSPVLTSVAPGGGSPQNSCRAIHALSFLFTLFSALPACL